MTDEPTDIIKTLESIRQEEYPDIPSELIKEIVEVEYETLEERDQTLSRLSNAVESHVGTGGK